MTGAFPSTESTPSQPPPPVATDRATNGHVAALKTAAAAESAVARAPDPAITSPLAKRTTSLRQLCNDLWERIHEFLKEDAPTELMRQTQARTRDSLAVIQEALKRYPLPEISLSYNGGKDCLVLLVLYLACLSQMPDLPLSVESIYIVPEHPFPQVDAFVASSAFSYYLSLKHLQHPSMRTAFDEYLKQRPQVRAIFVGTRRTDPHGENLTSFDMTDGGWPLFMRIHPVLDWHYQEIWTFIKKLDVPYCELYDMGYTSLGGTQDTLPNPALRVEGSGAFRPAHELTDDHEERLGRDKAKNK